MNHQLILNSLSDLLKAVNPQWQRVHHIADKHIKPIERAFLTAIAIAQGEIVLRQLEEALKTGNIEDAVNAINWDKVSAELAIIGAFISEAFRETSVMAAEELARDLSLTPVIYDGGTAPVAPNYGLNFVFNIRNPKAEIWVTENVAELVKGVTDETKLAIQRVVLDGFEAGKAPRVMAREIKQIVGLTERDAKAVVNYRNRLEAMKAAGKSPFKTVPLTNEKIDKMVGRYKNKKLRERGERIARTETIRASNMGQHNAWLDAIDQGILPATTRRKWSTAGDERVCSWCGPLDGTVVGMNDEFSITASKTENSQLINYTELVPPLHVQCRCSIVLEQG